MSGFAIKYKLSRLKNSYIDRELLTNDELRRGLLGPERFQPGAGDVDDDFSPIAWMVDETEFAVITRFGEIQHVEYSPGLKVKTPFIDRVIRLDNRLLHIDVPTATMPDVQKQNLEIDAYVRYRIIDPEKFLRRLVSELTAAPWGLHDLSGQAALVLGRKEGAVRALQHRALKALAKLVDLEAIA
mgnify:CR=1 FL=1